MLKFWKKKPEGRDSGAARRELEKHAERTDDSAAMERQPESVDSDSAPLESLYPQAEGLGGDVPAHLGVTAPDVATAHTESPAAAPGPANSWSWPP